VLNVYSKKYSGSNEILVVRDDVFDGLFLIDGKEK